MPAGEQATVTLLKTPCSETTAQGIYTALNAAGLTLSEFCQVWDLRFAAGNPTDDCVGSSANIGDQITAAGANNDTQLFMAFLAQGGHLFLGLDNAGYCYRDQSVLSFIGTAVPGCNLGYPQTDGGQPNTSSWTVFGTGPDNFKSNLNNLTGLDLATVEAGYENSGQTCASIPLVSSSSGQVVITEFPSSQIQGGNGKIIVDFDTNDYTSAWSTAGSPAAQLANAVDIYQNIYTALSTCFNFTLTKTVNPSTICVGGSVTFMVCLTNTGHAMVNPQITDVIPSCMSYVSSSPAGGSAVGNNFTWTMAGTLANGATTCVNIVARANSVNCP
jgi:uncharacterized repeat protein (TIGR01451 family)